MILSFDKLLHSLKEKKYQPVYFLHGPEPYFIDAVSDYIEQHVLTDAEKGFNQIVMYGRDTDVNTLLNAVTRYPMMSPYQVVIVKEAQDMKNIAAMESYFEKPSPTTILVMCHKYKSLDKRLKMAKVLEKNAAVMESQPLKEQEVGPWIQKYVAERGYKMPGKVVSLLAEYTGADLETLANNLQKLTLAAGDDKTISEKDIQTHVGISREYNVFELTNALGAKDKVRLTKIVNYMASAPKENPFPMIIGVLYGYFSKLTAMQVNNMTGKEGMRSLGVRDFLHRDYQAAFQNYQGKLKQAMQLLQDYDLRFKGVDDTGTDDGELLKEMVFRLAYL